MSRVDAWGFGERQVPEMRASQTINTITSTARSERPRSDIALGPREPHRVNLTDHDHYNYLVSRYCCFSLLIEQDPW